MKKIFSLITIFCFLINSSGFALCPTLMTDDLGGETYHYKFLSLVKWQIQQDLQTLNKLSEIKGLKGKEGERKIKSLFDKIIKSQDYEEDTVLDAAKVTVFFNLVENVNGNIFKVPMNAIKGKICENYLMLFSTEWDDANQGFPVVFCEQTEFERLKAKVAEQNKLPVRGKEKQELLDQVTTRHIKQNEEKIDKFIKGQIVKGNFAEIDGRAQALGWDRKYPDRIKPENGKGEYWDEKVLRRIENLYDPFLKNFGISVGKAFEGKNIVFIKVDNIGELPVIEEKGEKISVESHVSENAVYFFLNKTTFQCITDNLFNERDYDYEFGDNILHEIGVIYGMPIWISYREKLVNALVTIHGSFRRLKSISELKTRKDWEIAEENIKQGKVNLNHLYARGHLRDYAKGEAEVQDVEKKRISDNTSRLKKLMAVGLWNSEAFLRKKKYIDMERVISELDNIVDNRGVSDESRKILEEADVRLRVYLDLISASLILTGKIKGEEIEIENSGVKNSLSKSPLHSLLTDNFPKELDNFIREEMIRIGKQVEKLHDDVPVEIHNYIYNIKEIKGFSMEAVIALRDKLIQWTYGRKNVLLPNFDTAYPIAVWLKKFREEKKNKYWQTVEEDITAFWKAGLVEEVEKTDEVTDKVMELLEKYIAHTAFIQQAVDIELGGKDLPIELRDWMQEIYLRITGSTCKENWRLDSSGEVIVEYVKKCFKKAYNAKLYKIKGQFYVSPRTKEIAHVCRGIKQEEPAVYIGEKLYEKLFKKDYITSALLLFNEAMHMNHPDVSHGLIEKLEDIGIKNDHVQLPFLKELEKNHISEMPKPWDKYMHEGGNIYKSQSMINFFESVKRFIESKTQNVLFINAKSGSGATMVTKFMRELGELGEGTPPIVMKTIDCAALQGCSGDRLHELWFGKEGILADIAEAAKRNQPILLVIDHLDYADETLQTKLFTLLREEGSIATSQGKIDIADLRKKLKIVCFSDGFKEMVLNADLARKLGEPLDLPLLQFRGADVVLLAEYFNYIESEANGIVWSPFEESFGKLIAELAVTEDDEIQVSELRRFVQKLVEARKHILNAIKDTGKLPDRALRGSVIPCSIEKVFCKYLMTTCDMVYSGALISCFGNRGGAAKIVYGNRKKNIESEIIQIEVERFKAGNKYLFPYFKDELAPRITEGTEPLGFYKGMPNEQPGMRQPAALSRGAKGSEAISFESPYEYETSGLSWGSLKTTLERHIPDSNKLLANFSKGSALIFSEKLTFEKGIGIFLPKFVKAGMKVAVVAKTDKQRQRIDELNREMLSDSEDKIVILEDVSEVIARMSGVSRYYYFTIQADDDKRNIEGIINIDLTHMVDQIIEALAQANHIYSTKTIKNMEKIADNFRVSV